MSKDNLKLSKFGNGRGNSQNLSGRSYTDKLRESTGERTGSDNPAGRVFTLHMVNPSSLSIRSHRITRSDL